LYPVFYLKKIQHYIYFTKFYFFFSSNFFSKISLAISKKTFLPLCTDQRQILKEAFEHTEKFLRGRWSGKVKHQTENCSHGVEFETSSCRDFFSSSTRFPFNGKYAFGITKQTLKSDFALGI
jgi:TRAP-type C4-dicarboxylate transport system substrate-binding protein